MADVPLTRAFPLERPAVALPWGISVPAFHALLGGAPPTKRTDGHYLVRAHALGGLELELHCHFRPLADGPGLVGVEILRTPRRHRQRLYADMQQRLERLLGPGEALPPHVGGYPAPTRWRVGAVTVIHEWYYQGAEYQKVRFTREGT